jgi:hypothetical protein
MKYVPVEEEKLDDILKNLPKVKENMVDELDMNMYRE